MTIYYVDPVNGLDTNNGLGWWRLAYTAGHTAAPTPGQTITGAGGATGIILSVTTSSGTWGGNNAAGYFYMYGRNGTAFANGENITWSGGSATNNQGTPHDAIYSSFKTINKTFAAGDTINVAKSAETQQSGTGVFTNGSVSVTGISGWTPAQYNIIRAQGETTPSLYMVKGFAGSTITLYRPYRGSSGTKNINLLTATALTASDWVPTGGQGTIGSHITLNGGMNPATNLQDGFNVVNGNNAYYGFAYAATYWDLSNIAFYYTSSRALINLTTCTLNNIFLFRGTIGYSQITWLFNTINTLVIENSSFGTSYGGTHQMYYNTINGLETAEPSNTGIACTDEWIGNLINNWKNAGIPSGCGAISFKTFAFLDNRFVDPVFDETSLALGTNFLFSSGYPRVGGSVFQNPMLSIAAMITGTGNVAGDLRLSNIQGNSNDNRVLHGAVSENLAPATLYEDTVVYKTSSPSARMALNQSVYPWKVKHYIPCDANVSKAISVALLKNATPASTVTLHAAGSGYAIGDYIGITQGGALGAILQILTLSGSGVATFRIISGGYNYSVANNLNTTTLTGAGSGCQVNVTAVGTGYGAATLPIMRLRWLTGTAGALVSNSYDVTMPNTDNAWQTLSHTVQPTVQGVIILEIIAQSLNAGAALWYDDIGVI